MALRAVGRTVLSQKRKDPIVIERGALPLVRRGAVTRLTIGSETRLLMIGVRCAIVVVPVASDAVRRRTGEPVIHVALSAVGRTMLPLEWEDPIVIEVCRAPASRRFSVARSAISREPGRLVVRAGRSIVVIPVAGDAVRRRTGELIVAMAIGAIRHLVLAPEREAPIVVEDGTGPACSGGTVAGRTFGRKSSLLVVRAGGALVVGQVAAHAVGCDPRERSSSVTLSAIRRPVLSPQLEGRMIERGPIPTARTGVADFTLRRETGRNVIWILSALEVLRMAAGAFRDRTAETTISVTLHAIERAMRALETEAGDRFVVPCARLEPAPCLFVVAGVAMRPQLQLVGVVLSPTPMTGFAGERCSRQNALEMAIPALDGSVLTDQGKVRVVVSLHQISPLLLGRRSARRRRNQREHDETSDQSDQGECEA
jgi:hypothetical protein